MASYRFKRVFMNFVRYGNNALEDSASGNNFSVLISLVLRVDPEGT